MPTSGKRCATNRGRSPANNVLHLWLDPLVQQAVTQKHLDWLGLAEEEPDTGLGNGGLGRLVDLGSYLEADQRLCALYVDPKRWARQAILNVAGSGKFSSDRTIAAYAADIWKVEPCAVP